MEMPSPPPRLGIALGGGAARGWAHIGVLAALAELGIEPAVVAGTSMGALVGGIYAAGRRAELEAWAGALSRRDLLALVDLSVRGGAIGGQKLEELYREHLGEVAIEALPRRFGAVATDIENGAEVWLREGSLRAAIRASISLPGVFTPALHEGRWLVDGGLVNPVPVTLCRALGAELVVAVDVNSRPGQRYAFAKEGAAPDAESGERPRPKLREVVMSSLEIMQDRISRARLAGDPPELLLRPAVGHLPLLEFSEARFAIDEGHAAVERMRPALEHLLGGGAPLARDGALPSR
jgi:NTE family protein